MVVLPTCMCVCCIHTWCCSQSPEEGVKSPGPGVTFGGEPPCGCWDPNQSPLQEQPVVLIAEPYLWPAVFCSLSFCCCFGCLFVELCRLDSARTHDITQTGFELIVIHLPQPPKYCITGGPTMPNSSLLVHKYQGSALGLLWLRRFTNIMCGLIG